VKVRGEKTARDSTLCALPRRVGVIMGLPGSSSSPIHLSGGMKIENLDGTALVAMAFVFALISFVIAVCAIIVAIMALMRSSDNRYAALAKAQDPADGAKKNQ